MTKKKDPSELKKTGPKGKEHYTYAEAKAKVQALKVTGFTAYRAYCQSPYYDQKMPTDPLRTYGSEFEGWPTFCGKTEFVGLKADKYATFAEASAAAQKLGITTKEDYRVRHHLDPKLPAVPSRFYADWPEKKPWYIFLGKKVNA